MGLIRSAAGTVTIRWTGADLPGVLDALIREGIRFFDATPRDILSMELRIFRRDLKKIQNLAQSRSDHVHVLRREGLYWGLRGLVNRPWLVGGITFLLLLTLILPRRVLFIEIEGNHHIPTRLIQEAAERNGLRFGIPGRNIRSEELKNALLGEIPQLSWVGVNTRGCVARISVRERGAAEPRREESGYGNIVALRDGVILSATATSGNLLCAPGQTVTEGQVLISGYLDFGICIRAVQAQGEIYGQTYRKMDAILPANYLRRTTVTGKQQNFSLILGKKRINFSKDSGISHSTCGTMYEEYYVTLPGGFRLPIALAVETVNSYETVEAEFSPEQARQLLAQNCESQLLEIMVAGVIRKADCRVARDGGLYRLSGEYVCIELIGRMQREQIGDYNGKSD